MFGILSSMEESEQHQRERLITVLESLEGITRREVSLRFIFVRGLIYGVATVIGATLLISVLSFVFVQIFGVEIINTEAIQNIQTELGQ